MKKQCGAVLIFCLVLLTLLALMAVAGTESLLLRERAAMNARAARAGFAAAEAALRSGEENVWRECPGADPARSASTNSVWPQSSRFDRGWWEANGTEASFAGAAGGQALFVLESWRAANPPQNPPEPVYYRITARGRAFGDAETGILQVVGVARCDGARLLTRERLSWRQLN